MVNGNQKGKRGEREAAELLRAYGFTARRGQQFSGGSDSPDIVHSIPNMHIEVKRTEKFNMWGALEQAAADVKPGDTILVLHKPNRKPWIAVMMAEDLLNILASRDTNVE